MEKQIQKMETTLKKVTDEVQKIPAMENNIRVLLERMPHLLMRQEATEMLVQKMHEQNQQQSNGPKQVGEEHPHRCQQQKQLQCLPESLSCRMLKLPLFSGSDPGVWILKMERYFEYHEMRNFAKKMEVIPFCMSGEAGDWLRFVQNGTNNPPTSWEEFRNALFVRFEGGSTIYDSFLTLRQEGSVRDYCSKFELLGALLPDIPACLLEAKFINGLTPEIRGKVQTSQPEGITEIMKKAMSVKDMDNVDTSLNAMEIKGTLEERPVIVKIVSEASHNFISPKLATAVKIQLDYTRESSVTSGSGKNIKGDGIYRGVMLRIKSVIFFEDFLPLEMGGDDDSEVILGKPWLGRVEVDWKALTIKLELGGKTVTLQGEPTFRLIHHRP